MNHREDYTLNFWPFYFPQKKALRESYGIYDPVTVYEKVFNELRRYYLDALLAIDPSIKIEEDCLKGDKAALLLEILHRTNMPLLSSIMFIIPSPLAHSNFFVSDAKESEHMMLSR